MHKLLRPGSFDKSCELIVSRSSGWRDAPELRSIARAVAKRLAIAIIPTGGVRTAARAHACPAFFHYDVWKSVKYEEVYLKAYANVPEARASIRKYLEFYNGRRPHQSLGRQTPDQAYFNSLQPIPVAA